MLASGVTQPTVEEQTVVSRPAKRKQITPNIIETPDAKKRQSSLRKSRTPSHLSDFVLEKTPISAATRTKSTQTTVGAMTITTNTPTHGLTAPSTVSLSQGVTNRTIPMVRIFFVSSSRQRQMVLVLTRFDALPYVETR